MKILEANELVVIIEHDGNQYSISEMKGRIKIIKIGEKRTAELKVIPQTSNSIIIE